MLFKFFKDVKAYQEANKRIRYRFVWFPKYVVLPTHTVIHDNDLVIGNGVRIAMAFVFTDGNTGIIVEDLFFELSPETREFILYHEDGHIHHNHTADMRKRAMDTLLGRVYKDEQEADLFACTKVGYKNSIAALTEIAKHVYGPDRREVKNRIKLLKKARNESLV